MKSIAAGNDQNPVGGCDIAIGFVFPFYFFGMPRIVKQFVENLYILPGTYCFAVTNFGGAASFDTLGMLQDTLKMKGLNLSYGMALKMPGNYLLNYEAAIGKNADKLFKNAIQSMDSAASDIKRRKVQEIKRHGKLLSKFSNRTMYQKIPDWDKKFYATEKCIGCGLCSEVCPVANLNIENKKPVWQHHCERCLACIHWCPCAAIEYDKKTQGRRRYHHPDINASDIKKT